MLNITAVFAFADQDERLSKSINELNNKNKIAAYSNFIKTYQVSTKHPDINVRSLINKAMKGDDNSFAQVVMYIRLGTAGFYNDSNRNVSTKLALVKAMNNGSHEAAYWIGQSFIYSDTINQDQRFDEFVQGIYWLGVATRMGNKKSHELANDSINEYIPIHDLEKITNYEERIKAKKAAINLRDQLLDKFNKGLSGSNN